MKQVGCCPQQQTSKIVQAEQPPVNSLLKENLSVFSEDDCRCRQVAINIIDLYRKDPK